MVDFFDFFLFLFYYFFFFKERLPSHICVIGGERVNVFIHQVFQVPITFLSFGFLMLTANKTLPPKTFIGASTTSLSNSIPVILITAITLFLSVLPPFASKILTLPRTSWFLTSSSRTTDIEAPVSTVKEIFYPSTVPSQELGHSSGVVTLFTVLLEEVVLSSFPGSQGFGGLSSHMWSMLVVVSETALVSVAWLEVMTSSFANNP